MSPSPRTLRILLQFACVCVLAAGARSQAPVGLPRSTVLHPIDPPWALREPNRELRIERAASGDLSNGRRLVEAVAALKPGDRLRIGAGTWSVPSKFVVDLVGTAELPIWIESRPGDRVIITRPDAKQNVMDVGSRGPTRFLVIRGLEFTGGSAGVRLHDCEDVWFDGNEVHHIRDGALTANTAHTARLHITRNHLHHTGGYGEGMYLGANKGQWVMNSSVVALNHVHDCGGRQGDGIELKQGSWGNWIVGNIVHDTNYPCLLVYGTGGKPPNLIERNICWGTPTNVMQVQGEAVVRNNLLINGGIGFHTHDHQGKTRELVVVHNTIVTSGVGANLSSWSGREGMVLANNAVYSRKGPAVRCEKGSVGVRFGGNVVHGEVLGAGPEGFSKGRGIDDFRGLDWTGLTRDPTPVPGSPLVDTGLAAFATWDDLYERERGTLVDVGCVELELH
ncbi:MAG: hypothetical protein DRQ55_07010 [Planctomycetota bacterium]|nr:MAG: hypothetical protein DRQ55_07010 [Planctomycetota bacterium]